MSVIRLHLMYNGLLTCRKMKLFYPCQPARAVRADVTSRRRIKLQWLIML